MKTLSVIFLLFLIGTFTANSSDLFNKEPEQLQKKLLPPVLHWSGASENLIVEKSHPWITPAEKNSFRSTPDYQTTKEFVKKLVKSSPLLHYRTFGKSEQGRELFGVLASKSNPAAPNKKPLALIQSGIHAGEIDGKDATLMFLRDLAFDGITNLLDEVDVFFIPMINPDGHENSGPYNRVNQRGPNNMGWRTTSTNLNLNRDYAKTETPEMQSLIALINELDSQLYIDIHVTDGVDYQYDITFGYNNPEGYSPAISRWLDTYYTPEVNAALQEQGHIPGPLSFAVDNKDIEKGNTEWMASARYSTGYGDLRHLPTVLIENHSLKPYRQRVLGTYVLIQQTLQTLGQHGKQLAAAIEQDSQRYPQTLPFGWQSTKKNSAEPFAGVAFEHYPSPVSGAQEVRWLGSKQTQSVPLMSPVATLTVQRPDSLVIPVQWRLLIDRLKLHGIQMTPLSKATDMELDFIRFESATLAEQPFEGKVRVTPGKTSLESHRVTMPAGSMVIDTRQPLGDLAIALLDPRSEDSFFQWGYLLEILSRTEYIEGYVIEPLAREMLKDPEVQQAFDQALQDEAFAKDPTRRLQWFYERSPYYDPNYLLYPIGMTYSKDTD